VANRTVVFVQSAGAIEGVSSTLDNIVCNGVVLGGDVTLERGAANQLDLLTGDSLNIVNGNLQFAGSTVIDSGAHATFTTDANDPGVNVGSVAGDPANLSNGDIWYNSTTNKFRGYQNGAAADLISAGTSSGWTDDGAEIRLTTSTDEVTVGGAGGTLGKFTVVGDTVGQSTVVIQPVAAQTASSLVFVTSAGTTITTISTVGAYDIFATAGDANPSISLSSANGLRFGAGGASAPDVRLYRGAARSVYLDNAAGAWANLNPAVNNVCSLGTNSLQYVSVMANALYSYAAPGDTWSTATYAGASNGISWGAGGASAPDCRVRRTAANTITFDGSATNVINLVPNADNNGSVGTGALRWTLVRAVTVTSGDLNLESDDSSAAWTIREMPDFLLAINRNTGKKFKIALEPIDG